MVHLRMQHISLLKLYFSFHYIFFEISESRHVSKIDRDQQRSTAVNTSTLRCKWNPNCEGWIGGYITLARCDGSNMKLSIGMML